MEKPYVWQEVEDLQTNEQLLAQKYLYGKLSGREFDRRLTRIQSQVPSLIIKSLDELEAVMDILNIGEEIKRKTLQDMSFQYEKAVKQGYLCRFSVWFYETIYKGTAMYCATQIYISK